MTNINKRWITHVAVGATITLAWSFGSGFNYWGWATMLATFLIGSIGSSLLIDRRNRSFNKRIQSDEVVMWDVLMNGVYVGTVADAKYAAMQKSAFNDWHNAARQFFNLCGSTQKIITKLCIFVPFAFFWVTTATVFFSPDTFAEILYEIQNSGSGEISLAARSLLKFCILLSAIIIGFMFAIGEMFGFKNVYSDAVARMIRQHLRIPTEGDIRLFRLSAINFQHAANNL